MIFFGQASLRLAITQYMTNYHGEHNHRRLEERLLLPTIVAKKLSWHPRGSW
jgi:hypothetical protein